MSSEGLKDFEEMLHCTHKAISLLHLQLQSDSSMRLFLLGTTVGGKHMGLNEARLYSHGKKLKL